MKLKLLTYYIDYQHDDKIIILFQQTLINTSGTGNVNATIIRNNPASPDATFPLNFSGYLAPFEQPAGSVENSFF